MTRRFILTLAMLALTLGLIASAAPVGATNPVITSAVTSPPAATGPCATTGQTLTFDSSGTDQTQQGADRVKLTGNGFTVVDQNGSGMGVGVARCTETLRIWGNDYQSYGGYAYRITSATFHGGAHLAPGTQMTVGYRWGTTTYSMPFNAMSNYPNGYNGDYDLTIPNTVSPQGNDWSSCESLAALGDSSPAIDNVQLAWSFSKWDGGKSTLTGDHNGKYWVDFTLEWTQCLPH
jgi:hypothetical protein